MAESQSEPTDFDSRHYDDQSSVSDAKILRELQSLKMKVEKLEKISYPKMRYVVDQIEKTLKS